MSKQDDVFIREFGVVLGLLIVFALLAYFLGVGIASSAQQEALAKPAATLERIRPVGQVQVAAADTAAPAATPAPPIPAPAPPAAAPDQAASAPPAASPDQPPSAPPAASPDQPAPTPAPAAENEPAQVAAAPAAAEEGRSATTLYQTACMACHVVGLANAPKTGDKDAWAARATLGFDALVASVITGKGAMPPKAGNPTLTETEIRRAVKWFLDDAGVAAD